MSYDDADGDGPAHLPAFQPNNGNVGLNLPDDPLHRVKLIFSSCISAKRSWMTLYSSRRHILMPTSRLVRHMHTGAVRMASEKTRQGVIFTTSCHIDFPRTEQAARSKGLLEQVAQRQLRSAVDCVLQSSQGTSLSSQSCGQHNRRPARSTAKGEALV